MVRLVSLSCSFPTGTGLLFATNSRPAPRGWGPAQTFPKHSEIAPTRRTAVSLVLLDPCDPPGDAGVVMSDAAATSPRSTSYSVGTPL